MKVKEKPDLKSLNTFGVAAKAALRIDIETEEDLLSIPGCDSNRDLVLGGGSNVLLISDIPGTLYLVAIRGRDVIEHREQDVVIEVGAGENWHEFVTWCVNQGWSGLENLSLIPGSVGAAPMQNIGAYGVELSSVLESVTTWDWQQQQFCVFSNSESQLAYRDSRFKSADRDRYLITSIRLRLSKKFRPNLNYAGLAEELKSLPEPTPTEVSEAVMRIRRRKLPDPQKIGNAGSFFKNPILEKNAAEAFGSEHPDLPRWATEKGCIKFSAAWMVEQSGLKGYCIGDAAVSEQHALVLVNKGEASGREIWQLAQHVRATVENQFGVRLEVEPRLIDFSD